MCVYILYVYDALIQTLKDVMTLISMFCFVFFSWGDRHSAHRALQSKRAPSSLHDRWLHDVAQSFHHWDDFPISCGQCVHLYTINVSRPVLYLLAETSV